MTFDLIKAQNALTEKQRNFVELWLVHRNAHYAYVEAYDAKRMNPATAYVQGSRLLKHSKIAPIIEARLSAIGETMEEETGFSIHAAWREFMTLASSDPDEVTGIRVGACRHCYGEAHLYHWKEHEFMEALRKAETEEREGNLHVTFPDPAGGFGYRFTDLPNPDCPVCEGGGAMYQRPVDTSKLSPGGRALFAGVKPTANGLEIKLRDRDKALENAAKIIGAFRETIDLNVKGKVLVGEVTAENAAATYSEMIK